MDVNNINFRCSGVGSLMGAKGLGKTGEKYLRQVWIKEKYKREKELKNKYVAKGLAIEEYSMTLFSRFTKTFHKKNEQFFENDFIKGTPDIITPDLIIDIKSSYDIFTFYNATDEALNSDYYWQLQSYMWLTGKKHSQLAYCLTDMPAYLLDLEKNRLKYEMPPEGEAYDEACRYIDRSLTFGDIPLQERVHIIDVQFEEKAIDKLKDRIIEARECIKTNML